MKKTLTALIIGTLVMTSAGSVLAAETSTVRKTEDMKVSSYSTNNSNVSRDDSGNIYIGYSVVNNELAAEESNWDGPADSIVLDASVEGEGFTAVRSDASTLTVSGNLTMKDEGDGQKANDFAAVGAAISVFNGSDVTIEGVDFYSEGFGRSFAIIENSTAHIKNVKVAAMGADPFTQTWDGYYNSAQTTMMVSSPWVLGIQGGIRAVNVLGTGTTVSIEDSSLTSGGWAVVSTDGCTNPYIYIINSELNIASSADGGMNSGYEIFGYDPAAYGSGYGSFYIGGADETFAGVTINGATYGALMDGGSGNYAGLHAGETIEIKDESGNQIGTYTAEEDKNTEINTVFGVMAANSGEITWADGTVVNTADSSVIYKSGDLTINMDNAVINPENGIILQMIDNDDTTIGGFNPFGTYLYEDPGFKTEGYADAVSYVFTEDTAVDPSKTYYQGDVDEGFVVVENPVDEGTVAYYEKSTGGNLVEANFENGDYSGDMYNATGYYSQAGDALKVYIADSASLTGDIALTSHVHGVWSGERNIEEIESAIKNANESHKNVGGYYKDVEDIKYVYIDAEGNVTDDISKADAIQFTQFSTEEYYLVGHVLNLINYNGLSTIDVTVDGKWTIADISLVTYLNIAEGAEVYGEITELEDGSILITPSENKIEAGEYGEAHIHVVDPDASSSGGESAGGESAGEAAGESDGVESAGESAEGPAAD